MHIVAVQASLGYQVDTFEKENMKLEIIKERTCIIVPGDPKNLNFSLCVKNNLD